MPPDPMSPRPTSPESSERLHAADASHASDSGNSSASSESTGPSGAVAFQGELGAYSEEAVRHLCGDVPLVPCATFADVFDAVTAGAAARAVIPIENAVFGSVAVNYDHLRTHDVRIVAEGNLRVRHLLLGVPGASRDAVRTVRSHPQALGQCRAWLREHLPGATTEAASDTAGAARDVADAADPSVAAIASRRAADRYAVEVLAAGLEDDTQNYTRFLLVVPRDAASDAPASAAADTPYKTSVVFSHRENVPGALFKSLAVFALRDLDLYKIESRPLVGQPGRYHFYLDVAGAAASPAVRRALDNLREICTDVQTLGSYPVGGVFGQ